MTKIFIDGSAGTTGLKIHERLRDRKDLNILTLSEDLRKNTEARRAALNEADIAFLCLPDAAAIEAVSLLENDRTVVIDTSTAHRTAQGWQYGFAELSGAREKIESSHRIANPGCHASGFIALVRPLIEAGLLEADAHLSCCSLTGYSGGGKSMIAAYEAPERDPLLDAPRMYGLMQQHKHLKEMVALCGLENAPIFTPIVAPFYSGMEVTVPIFLSELKGSAEDVKMLYREIYRGPIVCFDEADDENGFASAGVLSGYDNMRIGVYGNDERLTLVARYDNLGKGASGSAIQNMNIVLGVDETLGLSIG